MCLQIGDIVAVLDDIIKGEVVALEGGLVTLITNDGMHLKFTTKELVKIDKEQHELSKFININNRLLQEKANPKTTKKSIFTKQKNEVVLEVDLHINQLVKTTKNLDKFDLLNLQLDTAKRKLEFAIQKSISKVIFIHGVGEGVLKSELTGLLSKYPVKFFDASYRKYGLGATEVYIYQNK